MNEEINALDTLVDTFTARRGRILIIPDICESASFFFLISHYFACQSGPVASLAASILLLASLHLEYSTVQIWSNVGILTVTFCQIFLCLWFLMHSESCIFPFLDCISRGHISNVNYISWRSQLFITQLQLWAVCTVCEESVNCALATFLWCTKTCLAASFHSSLSCRGFCVHACQRVKESREVGMGRRRVRGGGYVSSLTSILPVAQRCMSLCNSHVVTPPPPRVRAVLEEEQGNRRKGEGEKGSRQRAGGLDMFPL